MMDSYLSIANPSEGLYKEKGSKFFAYAFPVSTEAEIKERLEEMKVKHPSSRHVCYAWALGIDREFYRVNDAGEPSGTAGLPILGQLKSSNITNVILIVVRYFGGTKLGVSGLKNAYKAAAKEALSNVKIVEKTLQSVFELRFDYLLMNDVMATLKSMQVKILAQNFEQSCFLRFSIRQKESDKVLSVFSKMGNLELELINP